MLERDRKGGEAAEHTPAPSESLKDAIRTARIESAERSAVIVDLHDAELARLELLNDALDPLFAEIPDNVELFDRGISHGDTPRLWIDVVTHVAMGRDKREFRLLQDGRYGRKVLAASTHIADLVQAITHYVASRLVERDRALTEKLVALPGQKYRTLQALHARQRWRSMRMFIYGFLVGYAALFVALWIAASRLP